VRALLLALAPRSPWKCERGVARRLGSGEDVPARPVRAQRERLVKRTAVNPWEWSLQFGFNQGEVVEGQTRVLVCAGQTAVDSDGTAQHSGDMAAQIELALDNLEAVLAGAGMTLANVVRLNTYTTDVDAFIQHAAARRERTGAAGVTPPGCLIGVARLAFPELMVEFEATAMA
jgi:enamine deaminase RidA (YjgF/YER057c/UK114 family)